MKKYLGTSKSINPRNRLTSDIAFLEAISGIFSAVRHTHIPCELSQPFADTLLKRHANIY